MGALGVLVGDGLSANWHHLVHFLRVHTPPFSLTRTYTQLLETNLQRATRELPQHLAASANFGRLTAQVKKLSFRRATRLAVVAVIPATLIPRPTLSLFSSTLAR